jgi:hypothetical protein
MTAYNKRQLKLMLERIDWFHRGEIGLPALIANLDGLLNALEGVDQRWKQAFLKQWGVLEEVYADSLDKGLSAVPSENMPLINRAMDELKQLIAQVQECARS